MSWDLEAAAKHRMSGPERLVLLVAMASMFFLTYGVIGAMQVDADLHTLETALDRAIPFSPPWVLLYGGLYPVVIAPLLILSDRRIAMRGALGIAIVVFSGVPFWLAYPVSVPRPPVEVVDTWTWALAVVRYLDPPTNCFPSMHVAEAAFASLMVWRHDRAWGSALLLATAAIWYSSLAIGQHWFVDGLVGIAIALVAHLVVFRGIPREAFVSRDRRWHLAWVGLYVALFVGFASPWWFGWIDPAQLTDPWTP